MGEGNVVETPIKDTLNQAHHIFIKDTLWGLFSIILVHFNLRREDSLYIKDKMAGTKTVHYWEDVLLEERGGEKREKGEPEVAGSL